MDAPDAEELEWMAMQQHQHMIPHEDDDFEEFVCTALSPPPPSQLPDHVKRNRESDFPCASPGHDTSLKRARSVLAGSASFTLLDAASVQESLPAAGNLSQDDGIPISEVAIELPLPRVLPCKRAADIESDCIPVTGLSGFRVYAKFSRPSMLRSYKMSSKYGLRLLSKPIEVMMEEAERESFEHACKSSMTEVNKGLPETNPKTANDELWVDKYAPKAFTELLSDEQTNREVLSWLKQWDPCVFGAKRTSKQALPTLRHQSLSSKGNGSFTGRFPENAGDNRGLSSSGCISINSTKTSNTVGDGLQKAKRQMDSRELDQKVLLLCGPPGLGKTTLAHVAAKHCGYRVVEINASDDRVATTLQGKILDAIQMKSVMGDCKPNCLIIDEIDGALGGVEGRSAIASLLEIASAEKKSALQEAQQDNELKNEHIKKTLKKKGVAIIHKLSRPVICICNDQYAPALKSLRQIARVHVFTQPSVNRVVTRLKNICRRENFKANPRALSALAEHTECDIRSCLNTLQFLHRKQEDLKTLDVGSQIVGRKDMASNIFDVWTEIFQKRKVKSTSAFCLQDASERFKQERHEFFRLHELFINQNNYELTIEGVFENFLHLRYHDSSLQKTSKCLDLICDSEVFGRRAFIKQHFFINAYQPSFAIAIRRLLAQVERPTIEWPKAFNKYALELSLNKHLLRSWLSAISPSTSRGLSYTCLVQDMVPFLLTIISPNLRTVASQLLSPVERELMSQLVDTMIAYGISYKASKAGLTHEYNVEHEGLVLEPPLHRIVSFKDHVPAHGQLSLTLRQMIAHEVEMEKIHRESAARIERGKQTAALQGSISVDMDTLKEECIHFTNAFCNQSTTLGNTIKTLAETSGIPNSKSQTVEFHKENGAQNNEHLVTAKTSSRLFANVKRPVSATIHQSSNFFDRGRFKKFQSMIMDQTKKAVENQATMQRDSRPLLYKFNEGFTNAIKRPMVMRDFL